MSTGNFYKKNASKIFAICETIDGEELQESDFLYSIDNISFELKRKLRNTNFVFQQRTTRSVNELRSYESTYICSIDTCRVIAGLECIVRIHCFARSGYYDGACLDYEFDHMINGTNFDCVNESDSIFSDEADRYCDYNFGMIKIQSKNCKKWMDRQLKVIVNIVETVYGNCATSKLRTVAILSNGEAIYEEC